MARTAEKRERSRHEKRNLILQTAQSLFSENGYAATTIADVAKSAGVSFGSVFSYFESKEALFKQSLLEPLEQNKSIFLRFTTLETPSETVQALIRIHMEFVARNAAFLRIIQQVIAQRAQFPDLFEELDRFNHEFQDALCPIILQGQEMGEFSSGDPNLVATSYLSFLIGLRLAYADPPGHPLWTGMMVMAYRLFGPTAGSGNS